MDEITKESKVTTSLFEILSLTQKLIFNSMEYKGQNFTKSQLYILMALIGKPYITMTQAAACIASSKEQATRAVAPLVEEGYVERFSARENRKLVLIRLTQKGTQAVSKEREAVKEKLQSDFRRMTGQEMDQFVQATDYVKEVLHKLEGGELENGCGCVKEAQQPDL